MAALLGIAACSGATNEPLAAFASEGCEWYEQVIDGGVESFSIDDAYMHLHELMERAEQAGFDEFEVEAEQERLCPDAVRGYETVFDEWLERSFSNGG